MRAGDDLDFRGFLPAQFIMLFWGAELLVRRGEYMEAAGKGFHSWWLRSPVWAPLLVLGFLGTAYELAILRVYFPISDAGLSNPTIYSPDRQYGARALELRRAYTALDHILPVSAKVQFDPDRHYCSISPKPSTPKRPTAVVPLACGSLFGGDPAKCPYAYANISAIFKGAPDVTRERVEAVCREFAIDAVVITDLDRAWEGFGSWTQVAKPAISSPHVRVYLMGDPHE